MNTIDKYFTLLSKAENTAFDKSKHIILLTFDDNYVNQTINLILSISRFHKSEVSYICMCPQLKQANMDTLLSLEEGLQIRCYDFHSEIDPGRWPACAMFRLFAPWLLEEEIRKVLYMDSDIICTGSIEKLLNMETPYIAMCPELSANTNTDQQTIIQKYLPTQIYCNSGVCVFNLDNLRRNYSCLKIHDALYDMSLDLRFPDQDFLNYYFQGNTEILNGYLYNLQPYEYKKSNRYKQIVAQCKLIHFSYRKPWNYKAEPYLNRLYQKYSEYPPMKKLVQKAYWQSILYSPVRMLTPLLVRYCWPLADKLLKWRSRMEAKGK